VKPIVWHHYTPRKNKKERALCGTKWANHWTSNYSEVTCKNCLRMEPSNVICFETFKERREFLAEFKLNHPTVTCEDT